MEMCTYVESTDLTSPSGDFRRRIEFASEGRPSSCRDNALIKRLAMFDEFKSRGITGRAKGNVLIEAGAGHSRTRLSPPRRANTSGLSGHEERSVSVGHRCPGIPRSFGTRPIRMTHSFRSPIARAPLPFLRRPGIYIRGRMMRLPDPRKTIVVDRAAEPGD